MGFVVERLLTPGTAAHLDGGLGARVAGRGTTWRCSRFTARRRHGGDHDNDDNERNNDGDNDNDSDADDDDDDDNDNGYSDRQRASRRYRKTSRYRGCTRRLADEDADQEAGTKAGAV